MNQTTTMEQTSRRHVLLVALVGGVAAIAIATVIAAFGGLRTEASATHPAARQSDQWYLTIRTQPVIRDRWYIEAKAQPVTYDRWYLEMPGAREYSIRAAASAAQNDSHRREMNRLRDLNEAAAPSFSVAPDARVYERNRQRLLELNSALTSSDSAAVMRVAPPDAAALGAAGYIGAHSIVPGRAAVDPAAQSVASYMQQHAIMNAAPPDAAAQGDRWYVEAKARAAARDQWYLDVRPARKLSIEGKGQRIPLLGQ